MSRLVSLAWYLEWVHPGVATVEATAAEAEAEEASHHPHLAETVAEGVAPLQRWMVVEAVEVLKARPKRQLWLPGMPSMQI